MTSSIHQIDFIPDDGSATVRMLDYGDRMQNPLTFPVSVSTDAYAPIGSTYGVSIPKWGARVAVEWGRRKSHASHADAASYAMRHPASIPYMATGKLRIAVQAGETWDFLDAVILGCSSTQAFSGNFASMTNYRTESGDKVPVYAISLFQGIRFDWVLQNWNAVTNNWNAL
jgi:hypothetical protein